MPLIGSKHPIEMVDVHKTIAGRPVLSGVSLVVREGSMLALLGPNGAGKTTSIRTMTGLLEPDSGEVKVLGDRVIPANSDACRSMFGVQSDGNLYDSLSVADNLDIWGRLYGLSRSQRADRTNSVLELFALGQRRDSRLGELSKGLKQRVALARAILAEPKLLILDEPTAGLDPASIRDLYSYLGDLRRNSGVAILVCTHQLEGIEAVCDDIAILDRGKVMLAGLLGDVINKRWPRVQVEFCLGGDVSNALGELSTIDDDVVIEDVDENAGTTLLSVRSPQVLPEVVRHLVSAGADIYSVRPKSKGLEDLYFDTIQEGKC